MRSNGSNEEVMKNRVKEVSLDEFIQLLREGKIRGASVDDVNGTHHKRALYRHPNTQQFFVEVSDEQV